MTNLPGTASEALINFGQTGEYHTQSMSAVKQSAGFAPLETLPAEWFNNYLNLLDSHINQLQVLTVQIQQELTNIITSDSQLTPSDSNLSQVLTAINKLIADARPVIGTGSVEGLVKSSTATNNIRIDSSTGVMTPNALGDWGGEFGAETIAQIVATLKARIEHEVDMRESRDVYSFTGTITGNQISLTITSSDMTEHTATLSTVTSATLSKSGNTMNVSVNGVSGTAVNLIDTAALSKSGNTMNVSVNGVSGTAVNPISTATLSKSGNTMNVSVNGVSGTAVNPINTATLSKSGNNLNVSVNGVTGTDVNPINTATLSKSGNNLNVSVNGVTGTNVNPINTVSGTWAAGVATVAVNGVTSQLSTTQGTCRAAAQLAPWSTTDLPMEDEGIVAASGSSAGGTRVTSTPILKISCFSYSGGLFGRAYFFVGPPSALASVLYYLTGTDLERNAYLCSLDLYANNGSGSADSILFHAFKIGCPGSDPRTSGLSFYGHGYVEYDESVTCTSLYVGLSEAAWSHGSVVGWVTQSTIR